MGNPSCSQSLIVVPMVAGLLQPINYSVTTRQGAYKTTVLDNVKLYTVFYAWTHGDVGAFQSGNGERINAAEIAAAEAQKRPGVKGVPYPDYRFVFIDACYSAQSIALSDAFRTTSTRIDSAFLGWLTKTTADQHNAYYTKMVFDNLAKGMTIENAKLSAYKFVKPHWFDANGIERRAEPGMFGDMKMKIHGVYGLIGAKTWHKP